MANESLPCSGVDCVLSSSCRRFDDFENGRDGDEFMEPPTKSSGDCEFFRINEIAAREVGAWLNAGCDE